MPPAWDSSKRRELGEKDAEPLPRLGPGSPWRWHLGKKLGEEPGFPEQATPEKWPHLCSATCTGSPLPAAALPKLQPKFSTTCTALPSLCVASTIIYIYLVASFFFFFTLTQVKVFFFFFFFLGLHPQHLEVARLGVESEL